MNRVVAVMTVALLASAISAAAAVPGAPASTEPAPLLVVLQATGTERDGLPVYTRHPDPAAYEAALTRGFSGRLLRLYRTLQTEPAYLLLSENQGGFPRFGFVLDGTAKPVAGYVDLHRKSRLSGAPGAMDQIFPHELLHVIVRHLAGERRDGGSNQVHAIGVRTDPETAFEEGFAEHAQVMALEDADAPPEARSVARDNELRAWADRKFDDYERALTARFPPAGRARMAFPLWFGRAEQVLRYHGVRENLFALARPVPPRLRSTRDPYAAYLFENILPGRPGDPGKPTPVRLATEGVVAAFFVRWMSELPGHTPASGTLHARPGPASPGIITGSPEDDPLDRAYRKVFEAIRIGKPATLREFIRAYMAAFPGDRDAVTRVVEETFGPDGPSLLSPGDDVPEIWIRNAAFRTGTTMYDQFRGLPRDHTFDLNAATLTDLLSVEGMDEEAAERILGAAPFRTAADLREAAGVAPDLARRIEAMSTSAGQGSAEERETETSLRMEAILMPFVRRALAIFLVAAALGALAYRAARKAPWRRAALAGIGAAALALPVGWILDSGSGLAALLAPVLVFGVPASAWRVWKEKRWAPGLRVLAAWLAAALPSFLALRPLF